MNASHEICWDLLRCIATYAFQKQLFAAMQMNATWPRKRACGSAAAKADGHGQMPRRFRPLTAILSYSPKIGQ